MNLSVVIPIHNEAPNLKLLHDELTNVLTRTSLDNYELVYVDDGSTDESKRLLASMAATDSHVRVVAFRRNYGQTAAMQAGFEHSRGELVAMIDGDLQNDPNDLPRMVEKLDEGYDLIHGWRKNRQDAFLSRTLPSKIANWLISRTIGFPIHDLGCTLKVMRREIADDLELYGQMHRFIPILAYERGARCAEMVTNHRERRFGTSKYGISRTVQVILDLFTVKFMLSYFANPMRLFGKLAVGCFLAGGLALLATLGMKWQAHVDVTGNPLFLLGVFCWLTSTQLISLGLLGELCARLYYRRDGHRPFTVAKRIGFSDSMRPQMSPSPDRRAA